MNRPGGGRELAASGWRSEVLSGDGRRGVFCAGEIEEGDGENLVEDADGDGGEQPGEAELAGDLFEHAGLKDAAFRGDAEVEAGAAKQESDAKDQGEEEDDQQGSTECSLAEVPLSGAGKGEVEGDGDAPGFCGWEDGRGGHRRGGGWQELCSRAENREGCGGSSRTNCGATLASGSGACGFRGEARGEAGRRAGESDGLSRNRNLRDDVGGRIFLVRPAGGFRFRRCWQSGRWAEDGLLAMAGIWTKRWWLQGVIALLAGGVFTGCVSLGGRGIKYDIESQYAVADPQFLRSMGQLLGPGIVGGNRVTALVNGDQIFPEMLAAVRGAQKTITFETYIYWSGEVGSQFTEALVERAQAGVKVHLLLDWFGSARIDAGALRRMEAAGVEVEKYHPLFWKGPLRLNHRDHRKILVVDGRVGFTGGAGIADLWRGNAQDAEHWRDTQFRLEGPAVGQMQAAFMDNWMKTRNEVLHGEEYFPALDAVGTDYAQVFHSAPRDGVENVRLMYLLSIAAARKSIRLSSPYFVPGSLMVDGLIAARRRGVEVEVILPGPITDTKIVGLASRDRWEPLLKEGVKIYEYQPTMYHTKVMIVDDIWVSVGSANIDSRSFRLNDEANLNVFSAAFAAEQIRIFEDDKRKSREMSVKEWRQRSLLHRLGEILSGIFRSQL